MRHIASLAALTLSLVSSAAAAHGAIHAGSLPHAAGADVDARARSVIRALGTPSPTTLVKVDESRFGDGDVIVRYEESWRGLPVIGTGASVRFDRGGSARLAVVNLAATLPASSTPKVTAADAAKVARGLVPMPVTDADVHLVVWRTQGETRLAWVALPKVPVGLPTSPRIVVDAQSGELIEARDLVVFLDQTSMYPTNPIKSPSLATTTLPIAPTDNTGILASDELLSFNCIDEKQVHDVAFSGIPISVHTCELRHTAMRDVSGDFIFAPAADTAPGDAFSEVSMYYHASRAYQFFRSLQGDATAQVVTDKPLRTISNLQLPPGLSKGNLQTASDPNKALDPFQNAFFSPAGGQLGAIFATLYGFDAGAMWFGQGPKRDYSYDGDVIYHEFTHGSSTPRSSSSPSTSIGTASSTRPAP